LQSDLKSVIAYSSISHMGVIMVGLISQERAIMPGVLIILLSHGFCSSALFFLSNFNYEQNLTRQLLIIRGQLSFFYFLSRF
jgi:NADH:ubiquinone oxidoreductase subunit 4 (subunit M)